MPKISDIRPKIDAIDNQLLELLDQRAELVKQVGAIKASQGDSASFIRSGREADMARNLLNTTHSLPKTALYQIWLIIISSSLQIENGLNIYTTHVNATPDSCRLIQQYFGIKPIFEDTNQKVIEQLQQCGTCVGVFSSGSWWQQLQGTEIKIFAKLPFMAEDTSQPLYLAAKITPEPSDKDKTLIITDTPTNDKPIAQCNGQYLYEQDGFKKGGQVIGNYGVL